MILMNVFLIRYPWRGKGNLTDSRTSVRHICHRGGQEVYVRARILPPTLGLAPDAQRWENSRLIMLKFNFACLVFV
ncbi:hypothetical protein EVJ30_09440 [Exiguobacterium sp. SH5S13]|nr:hypothetical protein EVJ30_09440 [Exiguobacterium sp. SH5S13]